MDASGAAVAAGGIVRREVDGLTRVAVVRRERHTKGEWTLPKGKLAEQDASLTDTAVREVGEEAGAAVLLGDVAGVIDYHVDGSLKVVVFWLMTYVGEAPGDRDNGEVREVRWVPMHEAVRLLTHPKERALLEAVGSRQELPLLPPPDRRLVAGIWLRSPQMDRLLEEINDLALELAESGSPEKDLAAWRMTARHHVARAREAANSRDIDTAWNQAYRARECQISGFDDDEVQRVAGVLRDELETSGKFAEWRRVASTHLLEPILVEETATAPLSGPDRRARLQGAVRIRNEAFANEYRKLTLLRRHQRSLLCIGLLSMLAVISLLAANASTLDPGGVGRAWVMLAAVLLGIVGAVTSAAQRSSRFSQGRIPQQLGSYVASTSRIPIGAVAGLLAWLTGNTGLAPSIGATASVLVAAFAAGFTERLVTAPGDGSPNRASLTRATLD